MTNREIVSLPLRLEVLRPEGPGPFPAALLLHGCGGLQPMLLRYAQGLQAAGVMAVIIDSFTHRGIGRTAAQLTVCTGLRLRGQERVADLTETLDWLAGREDVDPARITAAGWSHGAWTIMDALALGSANPDGVARLQPLSAVMLVYPYCGPPALTPRRGWGGLSPPLTAVVCGRDSVVGSRAPLRTLRKLQADGVTVDLHLYEDATHAFDDDAASDPRTRYRADLAARTATLLVETAVRTIPKDRCPSTPPPAGPRAPG
jgi:dienelactone hydrolase